MAITKTLAEMNGSVPESEMRTRVTAFFDEDSFTELDKFLSANGEVSSVIAGCGTVEGIQTYIFAQDSSVKSGAVNKAAARKIKRVFELAATTGAPIVGFYDSNGGDMTEGMELLSDYSDIIKASAAVSGVVPQVAVVTGVCAGCAAMLAEMADITIMTEEAELFLTAPFNNPDGKINGAGKAQNAAKSGVADIVVKSADEAAKTARNLIHLLPQNNLTLGCCESSGKSGAAISPDMKGGKLVSALCDEGCAAIELGAEFGSAAYTAICAIGCFTAAVVSTSKADKLTADDAAKIARFVQFADVFSIPVLTLIDTEGFEGSSAAELQGSVRECAKLAQVYAAATTTKVNVITGKAFGAAFAALDSADITIAWEGAQIAPMSPDAAKVFMGGEITTDPFAAAALGMVDSVVAPADTRDAVENAIVMLDGKRVQAPARKRANIAL